MASGGFGRGGRGAALLQALKDPVRKPICIQNQSKVVYLYPSKASLKIN
jgi:hypothetical protein